MAIEDKIDPTLEELMLIMAKFDRISLRENNVGAYVIKAYDDSLMEVGGVLGQGFESTVNHFYRKFILEEPI